MHIKLFIYLFSTPLYTGDSQIRTFAKSEEPDEMML